MRVHVMSVDKPERMALYRPDIFDVSDLESAMGIILTAESGTTTQERWERETPYLVAEMGRLFGLCEQSCVLDYGCGIGRVAKGLIERYNCTVIGVDISASMRQLALGYVQSDRFTTCSPELFDRMVAGGLRVNNAYACWVLQHCPEPLVDIGRIDSALREGGGLFVLNTDHRCVPTDRGWASDGASIEEMLTEKFEKIEKGCLTKEISTPEIISASYTMVLRKQ
jgi:SAM-dependent methyltransferase